MHLLLIEDDPTDSRRVLLCLEGAGLEADHVELGMQGLALTEAYAFDLIILNFGLPDLSGNEVLRQLRSRSIDTPVLALVGGECFQSMLKCFSAGADDVLAKPFDYRELIARVLAILRRAKSRECEVVQAGNATINHTAQFVEIDGERVHLTNQEFQVLEALALRKGQVQTRAKLMNDLYSGRDTPRPKVIDVVVCKLRRKLSSVEGSNICIDTVWGSGYVLRDSHDQQFVSRCARPALAS